MSPIIDAKGTKNNSVSVFHYAGETAVNWDECSRSAVASPCFLTNSNSRKRRALDVMARAVFDRSLPGGYDQSRSIADEIMAEREVPVLIVGGSLVGLSSALFLAHHGIRSLTVEHHRGTAVHPRAAQLYQRTMELLRSTGLEQTALERSDGQLVQDGAVMAVESLAGKELAWYVPNLNEGIRDVSPSVRLFLTQNLLEPLLKARAEEWGAELRFGTDLVSFEQDAEGVKALIRDSESGEASTVRARYMIAADGIHSRVRDALQIRMRRRGVLSHSVTIYFRGPVGPLLRGRNLSVMYVYNSELTGFFRIERPFDSGFLARNSIGPPDRPNTDVWTDYRMSAAAGGCAHRSAQTCR